MIILEVISEKVLVLRRYILKYIRECCCHVISATQAHMIHKVIITITCSYLQGKKCDEMLTLDEVRIFMTCNVFVLQLFFFRFET